jgi:hypothetical protein
MKDEGGRMKENVDLRLSINPGISNCSHHSRPPVALTTLSSFILHPYLMTPLRDDSIN